MPPLGVRPTNGHRARTESPVAEPRAPRSWSAPYCSADRIGIFGIPVLNRGDSGHAVRLSIRCSSANAASQAHSRAMATNTRSHHRPSPRTAFLLGRPASVWLDALQHHRRATGASSRRGDFRCALNTRPRAAARAHHGRRPGHRTADGRSARRRGHGRRTRGAFGGRARRVGRPHRGRRRRRRRGGGRRHRRVVDRARDRAASRDSSAPSTCWSTTPASSVPSAPRGRSTRASGGARWR